IASRTLLGIDVGAEVEEIEPALEVIIKEIAVRFRRPFPIPDSVPTPRNLRYRGAIHRLNDLIYRVIRARRASAGPGAARAADLAGRRCKTARSAGTWCPRAPRSS